MAQSLRRKLDSKTRDERKDILTRALRCDGLTRLSALDALRNHHANLELSATDVLTLSKSAEKKERYR